MQLHFVDLIVKVAIIGGGISGIGSSDVLTKDNVEHIIIEGRDRIGGRITPQLFDGVKIELGAAFIHHTNKGNLIADMIRQLNWNFTEINTGISDFFYEGVGTMNQTDVDNGWKVAEGACQKAIQNQNSSKTALNLKKAPGSYFKDLKGKETDVAISFGKWSYDQIGNYNAASMSDLGVEQCQGTLTTGDFIIERGYSSLIKHMYDLLKPKEIYLGHVVTKIDYSGPLVRIETSKGTFFAEKVISTLPLGVLKKNSVDFVPDLPKEQTKAYSDLGNGIYNKVFVSFEQPFWNKDAEWVDFITKDNKNNVYSASRSVIKDGKFILCFFVADKQSQKISKFTKQELKNDFQSFLKRFFPSKEIKIRDILATSWHTDPFALGSYTYKRVGIDEKQAIKKICAPVGNKIWFAGEHCHPKLYSYSHGGFETGVWAAQNITSLLNPQ